MRVLAPDRSVRAHGDTKTERSRRTLALPAAAVRALHGWQDCQADERLAAEDHWQDTGLVFTSHLGAALDAANVRKMFKRICAEADYLAARCLVGARSSSCVL